MTQKYVRFATPKEANVDKNSMRLSILWWPLA